MRVYLKIKIKSLAAEAAIIRKETKRFKPDHPARVGLYLHRIHDVREESRSACLAYAFLRGRTYAQIETRCYTSPDWERVEALILKYGEGDRREVKQRFAEWKEGATFKRSKPPKAVPQPVAVEEQLTA